MIDELCSVFTRSYFGSTIVCDYMIFIYYFRAQKQSAKNLMKISLEP